MNIGLIGATFGLIFIAELPDKTFVATVVLSARHKTRAVWIGSAAGLIVQAGLGVLAGRLLRLLPHTVVSAVVTGLFFVGAAYLLLVHEPTEESAAERIVGDEGEATSAFVRRRRVALTTFGVITLAEFGDLTQVLIANLAAKFNDVWSVFLGASLAFIAISGLAVLLGQTIEQKISLSTIRTVSAVVLIGLGTWSLIDLVK